MSIARKHFLYGSLELIMVFLIWFTLIATNTDWDLLIDDYVDNKVEIWLLGVGILYIFRFIRRMILVCHWFCTLSE